MLALAAWLAAPAVSIPVASFVVLAAPAFVSPAAAQYQAPSDRLNMAGRLATTWTDGDTDVVVLEGPVTIEFERATLSAKQAVLWISPEPGGEAGRQRVQVVLLGDAKVTQPNAVRSGDRMLVNASVAGRLKLTAEDRVERNLQSSALYQLAESIRNPQAVPPEVRPPAATQPVEARPSETMPAARPTESRPPEKIPPDNKSPDTAPFVARPPATRPTTRTATTISTTAPTTAPTMAAGPVAPVFFEAPEAEIVETEDGTIAVILSKGVKLIHRRVNGDLLELQAQRVVIFTPLRDLPKLQKEGGAIKKIQDAVTSAYLEGDTRMVFTPVAQVGEQRLEAKRVYYEFATDRAILTDVVLHTVEPKVGIPMIAHAKTIRQLSRGEYETEKVELSTSAFAVPTYSIKADKIYIRQQEATETADARTDFSAKSATFRTFGVPFFWLPYAGGNLSDQATPLRSIGGEQSDVFGTSFLSAWGLFETFGKPPPKDLDLSYRLDYYGDRGPAAGLYGRYQGGSVTETSREPLSFEGNFKSYFVYDEGLDEIGRPLFPRENEDPRLRGHVLWEHQHLFPDDWQVQLRGGWASDQLFLEQYFPRNFDRDLPHDVSAYIKRQRDTEAFTLLAQFQPNHLVTTSDLYQEQFEVEHLPEISYRRIGDNVFGGAGTFYSDNLVSGLHFQPTRASLNDQGFFPPTIEPGIPSLGTTGITDQTIWRGDFRQQIDFPMSVGNLRVVPYVIGRYTAYSDSPADSTVHRLFGGIGTRISTAFWKVDDTVQSDLFDLHRVRHVIEPELNLFTSATTKDRGDVYIFDEQIDPINDVSALQFAFRQRWQTYRGGPGRWRSVDFFSLNVEANLFSNQPDDLTLNPRAFRGLYFPSLPENSVPRNAINADMTWRLADTTAILADVQWNADRSRLATASVGVLAQRGERATYYVGTRYIAELDSNIATISLDYQLSTRYNIALTQSFDFSSSENVVSGISILRKFDTLFLIVRAFHNETTQQSGYSVSIQPRGLNYAGDSNVLNNALENQRR